MHALHRAGSSSDSSVEQGLGACCSAVSDNPDDGADGSLFDRLRGGTLPTDLARGSTATSGVESGAASKEAGDAPGGAGVLAAMTASASGSSRKRRAPCAHGDVEAGASLPEHRQQEWDAEDRARDVARPIPRRRGSAPGPRVPLTAASTGRYVVGQEGNGRSDATRLPTRAPSRVLRGGDRRIARSTLKRHEPQGRQRDATSPQREARRKPSRWCETTRAEREARVAPGPRRSTATCSGSGRAARMSTEGTRRNPEEAVERAAKTARGAVAVERGARLYVDRAHARERMGKAGCPSDRVF